jgi:hypothetical protein
MIQVKTISPNEEGVANRALPMLTLNGHPRIAVNGACLFCISAQLKVQGILNSADFAVTEGTNAYHTPRLEIALHEGFANCLRNFARITNPGATNCKDYDLRRTSDPVRATIEKAILEQTIGADLAKLAYKSHDDLLV